MEQLYPEQKPDEVRSISLPNHNNHYHLCFECMHYSHVFQLRAKAYEVAAVFQKERFATKRELNSLSQIAADATKIFPPDFLSVDPAKIQAKVRTDVLTYDHLLLVGYKLSMIWLDALQTKNLDLIAPWYCSWFAFVHSCKAKSCYVSNEI